MRDRPRGSLANVIQVGSISVGVGATIIIQDAIIAWRFGAGPAVDAYQLALSFPVVALNVFAGGTLLAVAVPRLVQCEARGDEQAAAALVGSMRRSIGWLMAGTAAVWAALFPFIVTTIARDLDAGTLAVSRRLLWILLPGLVMAGLSSVEAALLNSRRRFGLLSALPAFLPGGVAVSVIALGTRVGIVAAALGWVAGSAAQWMAARWRTRRLLPSATSALGPDTLNGPGLVREYAASAGAAALLGGIYLWDTFMASTLDPGSTAVYGFASRPIMLVLAFGTTAVSNVALPIFSRLAAEGELDRLRRNFLILAGSLALAAVPIVLVVHAFARPLVALLYERGTFTPEDTVKVADVQQIYVLHAPGFMAAVLGWRVMNSLQRHTALLAFTGMAFAINVLADLWLVPGAGLRGIAWGTNAAFAAWALGITAYLVALRASAASAGGGTPNP